MTAERVIQLSEMPIASLALLCHGLETENAELKKRLADLLATSTPTVSQSPATPRELTPLERFGLAALEESREYLGDLDGGWIQDTAERLGVLVAVDVTEPCGEGCRCAEYGEFPQTCLNYSDDVKRALASGQGTRSDNEGAK